MDDSIGRSSRSRLSPGAAFQVLGVGGFVLAVVVAAAVTVRMDAHLAAQALAAAVAVGAFALTALITKKITGAPTLTYYHHEIAVLALGACAVAAVGEPVLPHLDATALGLGAFLTVGRIGCLNAGCCHGRPGSWGISYGPRHVEEGFPAYLAGRRLLPVQALESAAVAATVCAGLLALDPAQPGRGFALYVGAYAVVRFFLEELRGDVARRYWHGLSEAQWTSVVLACGVLAAERAGLVPQGAGPWSCAALLAGAAWVLGRRRRRPRLLDPAHVRETVVALRRLRAAPELHDGPAPVVVTSGGLRVSVGCAGGVRHHTFSLDQGPLDPVDAASIARLVRSVSGVAAPVELSAAPEGMVHVLEPLAPGALA